MVAPPLTRVPARTGTSSTMPSLGATTNAIGGNEFRARDGAHERPAARDVDDDAPRSTDGLIVAGCASDASPS